jgi:trimeric autotransporter adhesin
MRTSNRFINGVATVVCACLCLAVQAEDPAAELWRNMAAGGLITQVDLQYVLANGCLPGGTTVQNSPVPAEKQDDWNTLASEKVISAKELATVLFEGTMPNMTDAETKAFEELAPVYQPDRSKRLGYELRRKHQKVEMIRFKHRMHEKYSTKYEEAQARAKQLDIPTRMEFSDIGGMELQYFDDLGHPQYYQTDNMNSADSISSDEVWPGSTNGFSLTGNPVTLGIWDDGAVLATHTEFGSRVQVMDGSSVIAHHPSAVAGTMVAAGVYAPAHGMASEASIHSYDWTSDLSEMAGAANGEVRISNHSYGATRGWFYYDTGSIWYWLGNPTISATEDYLFGLYDSVAQERDQFVYDAIYYLPVWSAGNDRDDGPTSQPVSHYYFNDNGSAVLSTTVRYVDGYDDGFDTIGSKKTAKNILTVGAVEDVIGGYTAASNVVMSAFSGFGPTDDGRIKPDVVANGVDLATPAAIDGYYYFSISGTSFSAPSVSGSLGLLQQLHEDLHGTNAPLWASTYKGIVIHTANEAGDHPGPDYRFGWGLMNTLSIAQVFDETTDWNSKPYLKEVSLPDGETASFRVLADTNQPLRVTICWTDVPGAVHPNQLDPTNSVLVNDLDLRVMSPDGSTNFPWVLDPFNPTNAATHGDNVLDNVEQVVVENTVTGLYEVVISHKGSLSNGVQDVSILISGYQPENKDFIISDISTASNQVSQLAWDSVVGSLHTVMGSTNLLDTNGWSELSSPLSILTEETEWIDDTSPDVRFYRIEQVK